jgi:hypothetical protein
LVHSNFLLTLDVLKHLFDNRFWKILLTFSRLAGECQISDDTRVQLHYPIRNYFSLVTSQWKHLQEAKMPDGRQQGGHRQMAGPIRAEFPQQLDEQGGEQASQNRNIESTKTNPR